MTSSESAGPYLSEAELLAAARTAIVTLKTRSAIVGGLAMMLYGSDRLTRDVDLVTSRLPAVRGRHFDFGGVRMCVGTVPVDVIVRTDHYAKLYRAALRHAQIVRDLPVVTPAYLAAMKMAAARAKDAEDLKVLIRGESPSGLEEIRKVVKTTLGLFALDELNQEIEIVTWEKKTRRDARRWARR